MAAILIINNNKILKKHSRLGLQGFAPSGSSLPPSPSCAVWGGKKDVITFLAIKYNNNMKGDNNGNYSKH